MPQQIILADGRPALIDQEDFHRIGGFRWHAQVTDRKARRVYAVRRPVGGGVQLMHREILLAKPGQLVDHINGDTLDNRRANLRIATAKQNAQNSRPRGAVRLSGVHRHGAKFVAVVSPDGLQICLGSYATAELAAAVYNAAASRVYGEFARLNPGGSDVASLEEVLVRKRGNVARLLEEIKALEKS